MGTSPSLTLDPRFFSHSSYSASPETAWEFTPATCSVSQLFSFRELRIQHSYYSSQLSSRSAVSAFTRTHGEAHLIVAWNLRIFHTQQSWRWREKHPRWWPHFSGVLSSRLRNRMQACFHFNGSMDKLLTMALGKFQETYAC